MKLRAKNNNLILKRRDDLEQKQFGSIIVPTGDDKQFVGEIVAMGPGYYLYNGDFIQCSDEYRVGDIVVYPNFGSLKFKFDRQDYIVTKSVDIIAIIENE